MRKILLLTALLSGALLSCSREDAPQVETATGTLFIAVDGVPTKASVSSQGKERTLNSAQLLLFNSSDELYRYKSLTAGEMSEMSVQLDNVRTGSYSVALVANGPDLSGISTLASLNAMTTLLDEYNDTGSGFLMTGTGTVTVTADNQTAVSLELTHAVSRVVVSRITNALPSIYGPLTINSIMLTNVYGRWNLMGGKPTSEVWYNREGRKDEDTQDTSHIIDGSAYTSSCPDLLWRMIGQDLDCGSSFSSVQYLYAFPNDSDTAPDGFYEPFNPQQSCVVVCATFEAGTFWYPIPLACGLEPNRSYDVQLTIQGTGSDDPNRPVNPGTLKASVTVKDWAGTKTYNDNI